MLYKVSKNVTSFVIGVFVLGVILFIVRFVGLRLFPELRVPMEVSEESVVQVFNQRMQIVFVFASFGLWSLIRKAMKLGEIILEEVEQYLLPRGDY